MNVQEKLLQVQTKLKAPKSQFNKFGGYAYRNAEDILEAVKPLCQEVKALIVLTDEIIAVNERFYVKATARFVDTETTAGRTEFIDTTAYSREEETKKGMDGSQITGSSSSYARKYALNGLFAIDDTKDSDTTNKDNNNPMKNIKDEDLPFNDVGVNEPQMTLQEALSIQVKMKDGVEKKLGDLTDEQLETVEKCMVGKYKEGAAVILLYRAGQK